MRSFSAMTITSALQAETGASVLISTPSAWSCHTAFSKFPFRECRDHPGSPLDEDTRAIVGSIRRKSFASGFFASSAIPPASSRRSDLRYDHKGEIAIATPGMPSPRSKADRTGVRMATASSMVFKPGAKGLPVIMPEIGMPPAGCDYQGIIGHTALPGQSRVVVSMPDTFAIGTVALR